LEMTVWKCDALFKFPALTFNKNFTRVHLVMENPTFSNGKIPHYYTVISKFNFDLPHFHPSTSATLVFKYPINLLQFGIRKTQVVQAGNRICHLRRFTHPDKYRGHHIMS